METGVVKFFKDDKGFGFIIPDRPRPNGKDLFVHYRGIKGQGHRTLEAGAHVQYTIGVDEQGREHAENVEKIG